MKNKKLWIAVAGLVVLVIVAYGLYYVISRKYDDKSGKNLVQKNEELNEMNLDEDHSIEISSNVPDQNNSNPNDENGSNSDSAIGLQMGAAETIPAANGQAEQNNPVASNQSADSDAALDIQNIPGSGSIIPGNSNTTAADTSGTPAADFIVYDANGNSVKLSSLFGRPIVLNFWASWCNPCKSEMPHFQKAYETYGNNVQFVMVNLTDGQRESKESAQNYIQSQGYTFPVYFDSSQSALDAYAVYSIPKTFFINANGRVVTKSFGSITQTQLQNSIKSIMK